MLTNAERKMYASLRRTAGRREHGLFLIEGTRSVLDMAPAVDVRRVIATAEWMQRFGKAYPAWMPAPEIAKAADLERICTSTTPQGVCAVCAIPQQPAEPLTTVGSDELVLALDAVQDPGNLGTIIRMADWFGIRHILSGDGCVDEYNPKVVQSTMGAFARVQILHVTLPEALAALSRRMPVYGTFLEGDNLYTTPLSRAGVIVLGNEGNGISDAVAEAINRKIHIPAYPPGRATVESLNVSMAASITVAEFRRQAEAK